MRGPQIPSSIESFARLLRSLKLARYQRKDADKKNRPNRKPLSTKERDAIFAKTAGRCHVCGGVIDGKWDADHVLAHAGGGTHSVDNYLPAHCLCNNYRWDYSAEESQHILKLGVWLRTQIENESAIGRSAAGAFLAYEARRVNRSTPRRANATARTARGDADPPTDS